MRFAGNVIWFVFGGAVIALIWLIGAVIFAVSIVGLPVSRAAFEMAKMTAFPFGKDVVHIRELDGKGITATTAVTGTIGFIANIVWAFSFGWVLFLSYLVAGVINCITIIGIPFGIQSFKLAGISFWPVGRRVVPKELAHAARVRNAQDRLSKYRNEEPGADRAVQIEVRETQYLPPR
ncbi:YccF family protein [Xanthobacter sp. TB0136]|uniref:YccF family protein n=1 Tax=Xanthobacter sp. TB0136 TaxID=3459177 RepID=UPI00403A4524